MTHAGTVAFGGRISTLLLTVFSSIALIVLAGLITLSFHMRDVQRQLHALRDEGLPQLVKLSQLSQEAAATISIAPALSANPTRFEFETLLSRIKDKNASQATLLEEFLDLVHDKDVALRLQQNGRLLTENLRALTGVVSGQIELRREIESHIEHLRRVASRVNATPANDAEDRGETDEPRPETTIRAVQQVLTMLLDSNSARFPRNLKDVERALDAFMHEAGYRGTAEPPEPPVTEAQMLARFWLANHDTLGQRKRTELSNEFKIRALVEENSRIANRLLGSANNEFWRANRELEDQIALVDNTLRITLLLMLGIIATFSAGNLAIWRLLKRRVFERLNNIRDGLRLFADTREHPEPDRRADEIGAIFDSLIHYMEVINQRESQIADKTNMLEQLSNQLAKYLSPQVYHSIFTGKQQVGVTSTRKKLTVFFSDIAGFTETADRLESEELSQLLNHYLTEMSAIALEYGATIDKYVGDAILLFFGDPETRGVKQDATACVRMAIAMRARMGELSEKWLASGIANPLRIRMGINTGYCTVGNFGSEDRMDYTIIGGTVNVASRLESLATPGDILISYETFALVRDAIHCEEVGEVDVKGIAYPVATYRVIDARIGNAEQRRFDETHNHIQVTIDVDEMTAAEMRQARNILKSALAALPPEEET